MHFYRGGQKWRGKGDPSSRHFECPILNKRTSQPLMGSSSYQILNIASGALLNSWMVFFLTADANLNPPSLAIDFSPTLFIAQMMVRFLVFPLICYRFLGLNGFDLCVAKKNVKIPMILISCFVGTEVFKTSMIGDAKRWVLSFYLARPHPTHIV